MPLTQTDNLNVLAFDHMPSPDEIKARVPLTERAAASVVAGRGIAWNTAMGVRARSGLAAGARAVAGRVRRLPPLSAFGRGRSQEAQVRSGVGMR